MPTSKSNIILINQAWQKKLLPLTSQHQIPSHPTLNRTTPNAQNQLPLTENNIYFTKSLYFVTFKYF